MGKSNKVCIDVVLRTNVADAALFINGRFIESVDHEDQEAGTVGGLCIMAKRIASAIDANCRYREVELKDEYEEFSALGDEFSYEFSWDSVEDSLYPKPGFKSLKALIKHKGILSVAEAK